MRNFIAPVACPRPGARLLNLCIFAGAAIATFAVLVVVVIAVAVIALAPRADAAAVLLCTLFTFGGAIIAFLCYASASDYLRLLRSPRDYF